MTREEALHWLDTIPTIGEQVDALEMAIKALEQCEVTTSDCISRQAVLDLIEHYNSDGLGSVFYGYDEGVKFANEVNKLPSVNPQEPKTGHWIEEFNDIEGEVRFTCSCCGKYQLFGTDYCYNCGARMSEVSE